MMALGLMAGASARSTVRSTTPCTPSTGWQATSTTLTDTLDHLDQPVLEGTRQCADQQGRECRQFHTAHELLAVGRQPLL